MPTTASTSESRVPLGVLLLATALPSLITWIYFVSLADRESNWQQAAYAIGKVAQFALPLLVVFGRRRETFRWWLPSLKDPGVGIGFAFGLSVAIATALVFRICMSEASWFAPVAEQVRAKVTGFGVRSTGAYLAMSLFYSAVHSGLEEYYWRWFVFRQLKTYLSSTAAALWSGLGFMAHHVLVLATFFGWASPWTYALSLAVAIGGFAWALLYHRSGSLSGPWLSHMLVDAGIFWVGFRLASPLLA